MGVYSVDDATTDAAGNAGSWVDGAVNAFSPDVGEDDWKWTFAVDEEKWERPQEAGVTKPGRPG